MGGSGRTDWADGSRVPVSSDRRTGLGRTLHADDPFRPSARPTCPVPLASTQTESARSAQPPLRSPHHNGFRRRLILGDAVAVLVGAAIAFAIWVLARHAPQVMVLEHALIFVASFPIWIAALAITKLYVARVVVRRAEEFRRIWVACGAGTVATVVLAFALKYEQLSRSWIALLFTSVGFTLVAERAVARRIFAKLRRSGRISRRVAVIGGDSHALGIAHTLRSDPSHGYFVVGFISDRPVGPSDSDWLGTVSAAEELLVEHECTGAIVSLSTVTAADVNFLVRRLTDSGFHIALSSSLRDINTTRVRPQAIDGQTMLYIEPVIRDGWRGRAKRGFDVSVAAVASILSAPVVLLAAALIKIDSPGPVFFRQERVGRGGEHFKMLKLRTMSVDAENRLDEVMAANERNGALFKASGDPRITRVGRFLRKWSVDEIPQFYNVLRGDMSVVGPRPALPREAAEWDAETYERLRALPGITGLWQVEGRGNESFDVYKRLDLVYVDNWSLLHDVNIVMRTFGAVISRRGAI